jgi:hypothetical protein
MAGFGWQEVVILGVLVVIWVVPVWLVERERRRHHYRTALNGWVISGIFLGWIALLLWVVFASRYAS